MTTTTTTIRVSTETRDLLQRLARTTGVSMQEVLEAAVEQYRRQSVLAATNAAYANLHQDAAERGDLEREREEWDGTLGDGLEEA
jgi:predicted transcriptional regulator